MASAPLRASLASNNSDDSFFNFKSWPKISSNGASSSGPATVIDKFFGAPTLPPATASPTKSQTPKSLPLNVSYAKNILAGQSGLAIRGVHVVLHQIEGPEINEALGGIYTKADSNDFVTLLLETNTDKEITPSVAETMKRLDKKRVCENLLGQWHEKSSQFLRDAFRQANETDVAEGRPFHHANAIFKQYCSTIDVDPNYIFNNVDERVLSNLLAQNTTLNASDQLGGALRDYSQQVSNGWVQRLIQLFSNPNNQMTAGRDYNLIDESQKKTTLAGLVPSSRTSSIYLSNDLLSSVEKLSLILNEVAVIAAINVFLNQVVTSLSPFPSDATRRSRHFFLEIIGFASSQDWLEMNDNDYFFTASRYRAFTDWINRRTTNQNIISGFYTIQQYDSVPIAECDIYRYRRDASNKENPLFYLPQPLTVSRFTRASSASANFSLSSNSWRSIGESSSAVSFKNAIEKNVANMANQKLLPISLSERTLLDVSQPNFHINDFQWFDLDQVEERGRGSFGSALLLRWQAAKEGKIDALTGVADQRPSKHFHHRLVEYLIKEKIRILTVVEKMTKHGDVFSAREISDSGSSELESFRVNYSSQDGRQKIFEIDASKTYRNEIDYYTTAETIIKAVQRHDFSHTVGNLTGVIDQEIEKNGANIRPREYAVLANVRIITKLISVPYSFSPATALLTARQETMLNMLAYYGSSDKMSDHVYWDLQTSTFKEDYLSIVTNERAIEQTIVVQFDASRHLVFINAVFKSSNNQRFLSKLAITSSYLSNQIQSLIVKDRLITKDYSNFALPLQAPSTWRNDVIMPIFGSSYSNEIFIGVQPLMSNGSFLDMLRLVDSVKETFLKSVKVGFATPVASIMIGLSALNNLDDKVDALATFKEDQMQYLSSERRPLTTYETLRILRDLVRAIQSMSSQGLVHRDVKPGNMLIDTLRGCKLSDFGLTGIKGTPAKFGAGTLEYLPEALIVYNPDTGVPETPMTGKEPLVDSLFDIYALGVVLDDAFLFAEGESARMATFGTVMTPQIMRELLNDSNFDWRQSIADPRVWFTDDSNRIDVAKAPISLAMAKAIESSIVELHYLLTRKSYAQEWLDDSEKGQTKPFYAPQSLLTCAEGTLTLLMMAIEDECAERWGSIVIV
jgi:serine/threonine protein kinase